MIFVGADWDSGKCVVAFERDGKLKYGKVERNPQAVAAFCEQFEEPIRVGIETGDRLWARLWRNAGAEAVVFDAKKANRFGQSMTSSGASDDRRAARALLAMVESTTHREHANPELSAPLRRLNRLMELVDKTSDEVSRATNRLRSLLNQVHPAIGRTAGRSIQASWFLKALERAPTPAAWHALTQSEQAALFHGSNHEKRAKVVEAFGEDWNAYESAEEDAVRLQLRLLVRQLQATLKANRAAKKALREASDNTDEAPTDIKGIGEFLGAAIAIGQAHTNQRDGLALALGVAPVTQRSGKIGDQHPRAKMRRAAPTTMRKAGHLLGFQLVGSYLFAKAQFAYYRARGVSANGAYRRITRSFARILYALQRDKTEFDEALYIKSLKARGVPWALPL